MKPPATDNSLRLARCALARRRRRATSHPRPTPTSTPHNCLLPLTSPHRNLSPPRPLASTSGTGHRPLRRPACSCRSCHRTCRTRCWSGTSVGSSASRARGPATTGTASSSASSSLRPSRTRRAARRACRTTRRSPGSTGTSTFLTTRGAPPLAGAAGRRRPRSAGARTSRRLRALPSSGPAATALGAPSTPATARLLISGAAHAAAHGRASVWRCPRPPSHRAARIGPCEECPCVQPSTPTAPTLFRPRRAPRPQYDHDIRAGMMAPPAAVPQHSPHAMTPPGGHPGYGHPSPYGHPPPHEMNPYQVRLSPPPVAAAPRASLRQPTPLSCAAGPAIAPPPCLRAPCRQRPRPTALADRTPSLQCRVPCR